MATMQKIRETSPYILGGIAFLFVLYMVISDSNLSNIMNKDNSTKSEIGTVNGEHIMYADFEKRVQEQIEQQRNQQKGEDVEIDEAPIREAVWGQMVDEILLRQQAEKLGVTISQEEVLDVLLEDPPDYMRRPFSDSLGNFDKKRYLEIVTDPDKIATLIDPNSGVNPQKAVADFKRDLLRIEDFIRKSKLQDNVRNAVTVSAGMIAPSYIERKFVAENTQADVDYLTLSVFSIKDDEVKVEDKEIEEYYEKNKQYYKQKPARKLKYVAFPVRPSDKDSLRAKKKIDQIANSLASASSVAAKDSAFTVFMAENGGKANDFMLMKDLDPAKIEVLSKLEAKQTVGPVLQPDGVYFYRLDERKQDTSLVVKASHILVSFDNNKDSAKAEINKIMKEVKKENFAELAAKYSKDTYSGQRGGDVGYFGRGKMVAPFEAAAFAASVGSIVGPIESQFGYHIIYVTDKQSEKIKFSEIKIATTISNQTKNTIFRQAFSVKTQVQDNKIPFDTVASRLKAPALQTGLFERTSPALGSRSLTSFAFDNPVGSVCDPMEMKNYGVVVAVVDEARTAGLKPLKDMKEEIKAKLLRIKKLNLLEAKAKDLYSKYSSLDSLKKAKGMDSTLDIKTAGAVRDNGFVQGLGQEFAFTTAAHREQVGKISQPIRGERAYFIMQVTRRTEADKSKFDAEAPKLAQAEVTRLKNAAFYKWMNETKERANIVDNRSKFFR